MLRFSWLCCAFGFDVMCCLWVDCCVGFCSGFLNIVFVLLLRDSVLLLVGVVLVGVGGVVLGGNAACGVVWCMGMVVRRLRVGVAYLGLILWL